MQNGLKRMLFTKEKETFVLKEKFKYFMKILGKISKL